MTAPARRIHGWDPAALARRRALTLVRSERDAAVARQDGAEIAHAFDRLIGLLEDLVPDGGARRAIAQRGRPALPAWKPR